MKKFFSVMLLAFCLSFVINFFDEPKADAVTPKIPLSDRSINKIFNNMGYTIDLNNISAKTPDGYPIYGTSLPYKSLKQSSKYANTLILTDKNSDKILGVTLFLDNHTSMFDVVEVVKIFFKAFDEKSYQEIYKSTKKSYFEFEEFSMDKKIFDSFAYGKDALITTESMNIYYKLKFNQVANSYQIEAVKK